MANQKTRELRRQLKRKRAEQRHAEAAEAWQSLIDDGTIVPSGEMRPDRDGVLRPVYVHREFATKN
jgi:hypothetical protein